MRRTAKPVGSLAKQAGDVLATVDELGPEAMRGGLGFTQPMLDVLRDISLGLNVESSPSAYNDMIVVGSYARKIFGIRIE